MGLFDNANNAVKSKSFTKNTQPHHMVSDGYVAGQYFRNQKNKEHDAMMEASLEKTEEEHERKQRDALVQMRYVAEGRVQIAMGQMSTKGKDKLFKDILFETFYKALLLDDDFLTENKNTLYSVIEGYVNQNNGYKLLESAVKSTNSILLKQMKSKIDKLVLEVCARKIKDCHNGVDADILDFDLNDEEKEKLDYIKGDLNIERISELVKDKVLTVVQDEKTRQEKVKETEQDIEDALKEDDSVTDEKTLNEALQRLMINRPVVEDSTLFNSLMRNSYMEYLTENVAIRTAVNDEIRNHNERVEEYDPNLDEDDLEGTADPDDVFEEDEINMDIILSEAITKYTLMETLYTLKLEEYPYNNMRKLVEKMLNSK